MENHVQAEQLEAVFRANMRLRRKELGLTQVQLATRLEISQPYVAALENGERTPTLQTIAKVADSLQTTPSALLTPEIFSALPIAS